MSGNAFIPAEESEQDRHPCRLDAFLILAQEPAEFACDIELQITFIDNSNL